MNEYRTVAESCEAIYEEKRSRFIAQICEVRSEAAAKEHIAAAKKKYYDARHNTYAFIIVGNNDARGAQTEKSSDDGEPGGTAGAPMLNVLKSSGLKNVLVIVTRYFGGIKLGANGLVRAYRTAASLAVEAAKKVEVRTMHRLSVVVDYAQYNMVEQYAKANEIRAEKPLYAEKVTLVLLASDENERERLSAAVCDITAGAAITAAAGTIETREAV